MKRTKLFFEGMSGYLDWLRLCAMSERTVTSYQNGLEAFGRYLASVGKDPLRLKWSDFSADLVRAFLKHLIDSGQSMSTRNARLNAVKSYVRHSAENDLALASAWSAVSGVKSKRVAVEKGRWLTQEQASLLLKQTDRSRIGVRDHCILHFLLSTGLRLEEMTSLRVSSLHLSGGPYVHVLGKGGKKRLVPLPDGIVDELKQYIGRFHGSGRDGPLFYCKAHSTVTTMSPDNVQRIVDKYATLARAEDTSFPKISPHILRHTYAALLNRKGVTINEISLLLGHSSPLTTEIYAETDVKMIEEAVKKISQAGAIGNTIRCLLKKKKDSRRLPQRSDIPTNQSGVPDAAECFRAFVGISYLSV